MSDDQFSDDGEDEKYSSCASFPIGTLAYDAPDAVEVDADGVILPIALQNGLTAVFPLWSDPARDNTRTDELFIFLSGELVFNEEYVGPVTQLEFRILIEPRFFGADGIVELWYETITQGNFAESLKLRLIIRRAPIPELEEPLFYSATLWGYLNCYSLPRIWDEVPVLVPAPKKIIWQEGDECRLGWKGYNSLNASGSLLVTGEFKRTVNAEEVISGILFDITPFERYIAPMEKNASALATYTIYRAGVPIGRSASALVKIDRANPGKAGYCSSEADLEN